MAASVASLDHIVMQMHCLVNLCVAKFQAAQPTRPVAQSATSSRTGSRDSGSASMGREIVVVHSSDLHVEAEPTAPEWGGDGTRNLAMVLEAARRVEAVYHRMRAADGNLHVLGVTHDEALVFPGLDLEVWGRAHRGYGDMIPFERVRARRTRWQLAMAHGHYHPEPDRSTRLRPAWVIGDAELAATQSDYIALGHWNRAVSVGRAELRAYYSGSPDYAGTVNVVRLTPAGKGRGAREPLDDRDGAPQ